MIKKQAITLDPSKLVGFKAASDSAKKVEASETSKVGGKTRTGVERKETAKVGGKAERPNPHPVSQNA